MMQLNKHPNITVRSQARDDELCDLLFQTVRWIPKLDSAAVCLLASYLKGEVDS